MDRKQARAIGRILGQYSGDKLAERRCDRCHAAITVAYVLPAVHRPLRHTCQACYRYLTRTLSGA